MAFFSSKAIRNQVEENRIFRVRIGVLSFMLLIMFVVILSRVAYLQLINYDEQISRAEDYHIRLRTITPERGLVYDAKGRLLAGNILSYALYIHPLKIKNTELLIKGIGKLIPLKEEALQSFYKELANVRRRNQLILLHEVLTEEEIAKLMVNRYRLSGIDIQPHFQRFYPRGELVSHTIGYTGIVSDKDKQNINLEYYSDLNRIGKLGLERFYEKELRGVPGVEEVGVNAYGRVVEVYRQERPQRGLDMSLWLDMSIQEFVWDVLGDKKGTIIVLDANSGGIVSMISKPSYDNNKFVAGISRAEFAKLRNQKSAPLLNRAVAGRYPPGSTIKPFYSIIALSNEVVTPKDTIFDEGYFSPPNSDIVFRNWKRSGHGEVNLKRAIRVSSDTYFYNLAANMGYDLMREGLERFGFGKKSAHDIHDELTLPLPTEQWKMEKYNLPWFPGDTVNMGIGQGYFVSTPMQLAAATLILVNKGKNIRPRLVKQIATEAMYEGSPDMAISSDEKNWDLVFAGMEEVMHHKEGTARRAGYNAAYRMAGKTGTSQVISLKIIEAAKSEGREIREEWEDHASFTGYVPADDPKYIVTVVLENGGSGSRAALLAREVTDYLILGEDKIGLK